MRPLRPFASQVAATFFIFLLGGTALGFAQSNATDSQKSTGSGVTSASTVAFDPASLDPSVNPCNDFYAYVCTRWKHDNPIPPDEAAWNTFSELAQRNREELRTLAEKAEIGGSKRTPTEQKVGDFYAACMNESRVEALGAKPLEPELKRIDALKSTRELPAEMAHLQRVGVSAMFRFGSEPDFKDVNQVIAGLDQGGLGMPDRDYYTKTDAKSVELRQKYQQHVAKILQLAGDPAEQASAEAATVMKIETSLANASLERADRRDPYRIYHKMTVAQATALSPNFDLRRFFTDAGVPGDTPVNVAVPDFFKNLNVELTSIPLNEWKIYLKWHLVHSAAPDLSSAFVNENFDFYGKTLTGAKELRPRWKRCIQFEDGEMGEAIGKLYVAATFGPKSKQRTRAMVRHLEAALGRDIQSLDWMTPTTKKRALLKLHAIMNHIGYPTKWRDYSTLAIKPDDFFGNMERGEAFEFHRDVHKIGRPLNRHEWGMSPPTVNAYYTPLLNAIFFPAGILQPPFFDNRLDDAFNFGGIGAVIGHELTHGFDDQGSQFDAEGNLRNWWTPEDEKNFKAREECIVREYAAFEPLPGVHLNGRLTLGENTADNGGLRIAYMALLAALAGRHPAPQYGLTNDQQFFVGWARVWCGNRTEQYARLTATVDPHSPGRFRVNGVLGNMSEFQKAFHCGGGTPMVRDGEACHVW
jgi:putative endopeptidase